MITTAMGVSNARPKARNNVNTKSKYFWMSVITATPVGAKVVIKRNTTGKTTKYANDIPTIKRMVLVAIKGRTSFFSCRYRPGATNAHP